MKDIVDQQKLPQSGPRRRLKSLPAPRCAMQARTTGSSMLELREPQEGKYEEERRRQRVGGFIYVAGEGDHISNYISSHVSVHRQSLPEDTKAA